MFCLRNIFGAASAFILSYVLICVTAQHFPPVVPITESKASSPTLCVTGLSLGPGRWGVFQRFRARNFRTKHVAEGKISPLRRFSIPLRESLSDARIEICSSTVILRLNGFSGRFELFGRIFSSLCFRLLHPSFQP